MFLRRVILSCFLCSLFATTYAATITVKPGDKLQAFIDKAEPGDTILIRKGCYPQHNIMVHKSIALIGEDYPVFDGEKKHEVFFITTGNVLLEGLQVQNTGKSGMVDMAGIKIQNAANVTIRNCRILYTTYGIYLQNSTHCLVENNTVQSDAKSEIEAGNGVHAWKCNNLLIKNNSLSRHRDGIYFEFVTESLVDGNNSFDNIRYGLHFMFSHNDTYNNNHFRNNGAGVAVMYTKGVTMTKNSFYHNWGDASYAILLKEISDSKVEQNKFHKNTVGIYMEGSSRIHIASNDFKDNGWALRIQASCDDNVIERNNFSGNSFDVATNGSVSLNLFRSNYWDKYDGYDLDRDGKGDIPYYPVSIYSVLTERIPVAMILYRSLLTNIMDQVERVIPSIIPDHLKDEAPKMKKWKL